MPKIILDFRTKESRDQFLLALNDLRQGLPGLRAIASALRVALKYITSISQK